MTKTVKAYALFLPELKQLLASGDHATLKSALREINPVDLAEGWKAFTREEQLTLFQLLATRRAVVVFEELDVEDQIFLLQVMEAKGTDQMFTELPPGEAAHLFRKLPRRVLRRLGNLVKREEAAEHLKQVLAYPPRTAGSLMHTEVVRLKETMTASQALEMIRAVSRSHVHEEGLLANLYVTNGQGKLVGFVSLQALVAAPHDGQIRELMTSTLGIQIPAASDQEEAARVVSKYNLLSAPVVNDSGELVGVLLVDDVLDVIRQEASEDIAKMVGTRPEEFLRQPATRVVGFRLPWLIATILGELLVSLVIRHFHGTLQEIVALASFFPLIAAMGGNVGSQSATVVVRGLATGAIRAEEWARVIFLEFRVGFLLGAAYGLVVGGFAHLLYGHQLGWAFSAVVAIGMLTSMTVASTMGSAEPFIFRRFGVDPAIATGPLITTTTDLISTSTYLILATAILL